LPYKGAGTKIAGVPEVVGGLDLEVDVLVLDVVGNFHEGKIGKRSEVKEVDRVGSPVRRNLRLEGLMNSFSPFVFFIGSAKCLSALREVFFFCLVAKMLFSDPITLNEKGQGCEPKHEFI